MKLEIAVLAGAESKAFLADLTKQIDRLERLGGVKPATASKVAATDDADDEDDEDFAATPAPTGKKGKATAKAAATFEDDEDEETETATDDADDEEDFTTPAPTSKKTKAKKLTIDDVNDACKARARAGGKEGCAQVLAILKKNFKTQSVTEIAEDKWPAVIKAMAV